MLSVDRDALICDLAETYGVLDYAALPVMTLATLSVGLHEDSRIKLQMAGLKEIAPSFALVHLADTVTLLIGALADTKKKPELFYDVMTGKQKEVAHGGFLTIDEFETARARILDGK